MSPRVLGTVFLRLLGLLFLYEGVTAWLPKLIAFSFGLPAPTRVVAMQLGQWLAGAAPPLVAGALCLVFAPQLARRLFPADASAAPGAIGPRTLCLAGIQVIALWIGVTQVGPLAHAWLDWRAVATNPRISPEVLALELPPLERRWIAEAIVMGAAFVVLVVARPLARVLAPRDPA